MLAPDERILRVHTSAAQPRLSVLTPFHKHDPSALIEAFGRAPDGVEFILLDDGSNDLSLLARLDAALIKTGAPAQIVVWRENRGRAAARNRLIAEARGEYVLFLDADMLPDAPNFLAIWLGVIATQQPVAAFGGLSLARAERTAETALHYNLFGASDCHSAAKRARTPAQSTASANLLVRRDFLASHPFDNSFTGWGFEDIDWALTVTREAEIFHVDNPATHVGLDSVATLMRKSAEAGPNFARLAQKHPEAVTRFAAHRTALALRFTPARATTRRACAWIAQQDAAPMAVRRAAFKLFRATHYAEHLS